MPELPAEAVQAVAEALRTKQWGRSVLSVHGSHAFHGECEVCQGNLPAMAEVAVEAAAPFLAGVGSPVSCPSAAPESTHSPQSPSVAPVYRSVVERPAESRSELRDRYVEAITHAECEKQPRCAGCMADAVLAVRDDELAAAVARADRMAEMVIEKDREATQWADWLHQAEAAIARVRAAHPRVDTAHGACCQGCGTSHVFIFWPCQVIRDLDGLAAVSEEHTGGGNG